MKALELFASTPRVWFSQIRMTHLSSNVFSAKFITLFPSGFGVDTHPFTYEGEKGAWVRFVLKEDEQKKLHVDGFTVCGIIRGAESIQGDCTDGVENYGNTVVWFKRVD